MLIDIFQFTSMTKIEKNLLTKMMPGGLNIDSNE